MANEEEQQDWNDRWNALNQVRQSAVKVLELWDAASQYSIRTQGTTIPSAQAEALRLAVCANVDLRNAEVSSLAIEKIRSKTLELAELAAEKWATFAVAPHFFWTGVLRGFFETGTEGVLWSLEEVPFRGYAGLHVLQDNDEVTVFRADDSVRWQGIVDLEYETGYRPYPGNPQYGQQSVFGMWLHGNQRGMDPEEWAGMFFPRSEQSDQREPLRANVKRTLD